MLIIRKFRARRSFTSVHRFSFQFLKMSFIELDTISKAHISMFPPLLGIAFIVWYLCHAIHFRYRRLLFQKKHPCVEARRMPQGLDILGLGVTLGRTKAALKHRVLSREIESHQTYGRTYSFLSGGRTVIRTIEPDNVKTILATKFEDYNLGEARMRFMGPLLGKGIFTADGKDWNVSTRTPSEAFDLQKHNANTNTNNIFSVRGHFCDRHSKPLMLPT